jgi:hypothetical protein
VGFSWFGLTAGRLGYASATRAICMLAIKAMMVIIAKSLFGIQLPNVFNANGSA